MTGYDLEILKAKNESDVEEKQSETWWKMNMLSVYKIATPGLRMKDSFFCSDISHGNNIVIIVSHYDVAAFRLPDGRSQIKTIGTRRFQASNREEVHF